MCRCRLLNSAFSGIFFFSSSFLLSSLSVDDVYSAFSGIFYFFAERPIFFSGGEGLVINEEEERENINSYLENNLSNLRTNLEKGETKNFKKLIEEKGERKKKKEN